VPAYIETVTQSGGPTVTELRGGPFDSRADASAAIAKIREAGLSSGDASPALAPAPAPAPSASNCAFEGATAGDAAKYSDVEGESERLRTARAQGDVMQAANIKAIFENPEIQKLSSDNVADLAEKACLSGTDLTTYKVPEPASTSKASAPVEASDATPATYTTSFDCSKAKSDSEHLICENADLAEKDVQLAEVVKQASAHATDQAAFKDGLRQAWNQRERECHDKDCVSRWYDDQLSALKPVAQPGSESDPMGMGSVVVPGTKDGDCKKAAIVEGVAASMAEQGIPLAQALSKAQSQAESEAMKRGYAWVARGKSSNEVMELSHAACMMQN
jgi:uncharacterized protein